MAYTTWTYKPKQSTILKLSRSRLELFLDCRRCFWLLLRHNIKRPSMPPFLLNQAVDELLKKEFDIYRKKAQPHPLMVAHELAAVPFAHEDLNLWRNAFKGLQYQVLEHNFLIFGGIDDVWLNQAGELLVVDYKATARLEPVVELSPAGGYHDAYRRQVEIYQWLFAKNGFKVNPSAYFVYATAVKTKLKFANKLNFNLNLVHYQGSTDWVDNLLIQVKACLDGDLPRPAKVKDNQGQPLIECEHCAYVHQRLSLGAKIRQAAG